MSLLCTPVSFTTSAASIHRDHHFVTAIHPTLALGIFHIPFSRLPLVSSMLSSNLSTGNVFGLLLPSLLFEYSLGHSFFCHPLYVSCLLHSYHCGFNRFFSHPVDSGSPICILIIHSHFPITGIYTSTLTSIYILLKFFPSHLCTVFYFLIITVYLSDTEVTTRISIFSKLYKLFHFYDFFFNFKH